MSIASGRASGENADGDMMRRVTTVPRLERSATTLSRSSISPSTGIEQID